LRTGAKPARLLIDFLERVLYLFKVLAQEVCDVRLRPRSQSAYHTRRRGCSSAIRLLAARGRPLDRLRATLALADLDSARLCLLGHWQLERQHTAVVIGLDPVGVEGITDE
jgi:hypothetical protein